MKWKVYFHSEGNEADFSLSPDSAYTYAKSVLYLAAGFYWKSFLQNLMILRDIYLRKEYNNSRYE